MKVYQPNIKGLLEFKPDVYHDVRGYFVESFNSMEMEKHLPGVRFVQDNQSYSERGVVRGLHFQLPPYGQAKLVRAVTGKVLDVALDLRPDSITYGEYHSVILDSEKQNMLYIPEGFAHGFAALEDSVFAYKCTNFYSPDHQGGIIWNDEILDIDWNLSNPKVSERDGQLMKLTEYIRWASR